LKYPKERVSAIGYGEDNAFCFGTMKHPQKTPQRPKPPFGCQLFSNRNKTTNKPFLKTKTSMEIRAFFFAKILPLYERAVLLTSTNNHFSSLWK